MAQDTRRDLEQELAAAAALKEQLIAVLGVDNADAITLRDTIEGETNLLEVMQAVVAQIGEDMAVMAGLDDYARKLASRKSRLEIRVDLLRTMLANAVDTVGGQTHRYAIETLAAQLTERALAALSKGRLDAVAATVSLQNVAPKLVAVDEAAIPSAWWKAADPKLDKRGLTEALRARAKAIAEGLDRLATAREAGALNEAGYQMLKEQLLAENPPIPGAELDNGSMTVQVRFQ